MADETKPGAGNDPEKTAKPDEAKKTEKTFDQDSIQHGINIAMQKSKSKIEAMEKELVELQKFRDEKELEKAEAEQKDLEKKQEYQKIIEKNQKQFSEKEQKFNQTIGTLETDIRRLVIDSEIAKVAPELKVIPEAINDFIRITAPLMGYAKEEIDGQINYKVYPNNNGNPMINDQGKEMTVKEYLDKYLENKPFFRQPLTQGGSGGRSGRSSSSSIQTSRDAIHEGMKQLYNKQ